MEKKELATKLRTQEKRIDHLVRAMRQEEIPLLEKHIAEKKIRDKEEWEKAEDERVCIYTKLFSSIVLKRLKYKDDRL